MYIIFISVNADFVKHESDKNILCYFYAFEFFLPETCFSLIISQVCTYVVTCVFDMDPYQYVFDYMSSLDVHNKAHIIFVLNWHYLHINHIICFLIDMLALANSIKHLLKVSRRARTSMWCSLTTTLLNNMDQHQTTPLK